MSELPINPTLSKMLFNSGEFECVQEMAIIVAMLQVSKKFFYLAKFCLSAFWFGQKLFEPDQAMAIILAILQVGIKLLKSQV